MRTAVVVGNPKPRSRTFEAAHHVARLLQGRDADVSIDVVDFGADLLEPGPPSSLRDAHERIADCDLVVVASPTYRAQYSGLLKLFLDRLDRPGLQGVTAVPLMLGASLAHSLAPEIFLRPLLVELGATCPTPGLYLLESESGPSDRLQNWLELARDQVEACVRRRS